MQFPVGNADRTEEIMKDLVRALGIACLLVMAPAIGHAQQAAPPAAAESAELAKKLANPISDLVSVPFQFNWEQNVGPSELTRFTLNVQPVMQFGFGAFAAHPEVGPSWKIRAAVVILLPRTRK
jgi:hypothetical protein